MTSCGFKTNVVALLMLFAGLTLVVVAIATNHWYWAETPQGVNDSDEVALGNYHFGFWFKCYDEVPKSIPGGDVTGDCVDIYPDVISKPDQRELSSDEKFVNDLALTYMSLSVVTCAGVLVTLVTMLCGLSPGDRCCSCEPCEKRGLYCLVSAICLFTVLASMASGICFIMARDIEESQLNLYDVPQDFCVFCSGVPLNHGYGWSFILHWVGSGLILLANLLLLCMCCESPPDAKSNPNYFHNHRTWWNGGINTLAPPDTYRDPYRRHGDPYTRHGDPYTRHGDPYTRHGDPYSRQGDPYMRSGDPYTRHGDSYTRQGLGPVHYSR